MAELNTKWDYGETRGPIKELTSGKAKAAITAGSILAIDSIDANLNKTVVTNTGKAAKFCGVALYDTAKDAQVQILTRGIVKLREATDGTAGVITAGSAIHVVAGKLAPSTTGSVGVAIGRNLGATTANGDTGVIAYIDAGGSA